ncbi:glucose 1-dehydrogenase [Saccharothrix violaceirubra]|uniref:NAD(P)-dependent dehydrogenase (Short-subunit alcohol dehydrogenase family) n=1 Tax=Saccharothrix violaceirubra TaxID=413306 RepID=A0A7W7WVI8_9PSEU|nr:SDR family oxidoreductase [Saccharothrix violaceirubra]MBB4965116.1 NAD(P)-dependent dehydrogenase (short-subunit alcohol dehydrogenase family) [Saccharothrix violaceirubra]
MRFEDRVVLVTGAGSGIGRAVAVGFGAEGAHVVLAGRDVERLAEVADAVGEAGGTALPVPTDVSDSHSVDALFREVDAEYGILHSAANCAGVWETGCAADMSDIVWDRVIGTNLTGLWRCLRGEVRLMVEGGAIVNVASVVGRHHSVPGAAAYAASKAGVEALSRTAAREYIGRGIRINTVSPGRIDTLHLAGADHGFGSCPPIGRVGGLAEAANAVLFACSDESSYFVGHDFVLDGGVTA